MKRERASSGGCSQVLRSEGGRPGLGDRGPGHRQRVPVVFQAGRIPARDAPPPIPQAIQRPAQVHDPALPAHP